MNQTLEQLIKLQEIDQRLMEIREHMGDLPSTVETQEAEIAALEKKNTQNKEGLVDIEKNIRYHEAEIEDFTGKLDKYKEQLFLVKSNKEYDAISQEIDHMKITISDSEAIQLNFELEKLKLEENIKINSNKIDSISELLANNKLDLDAAMADTIQEQKELELNRNSLFKKIESNYLDNYETLRNSKGGVGMASIIGSACGGCYSQLPPQTVIEIKENNNIITCPNCSVMQFWDGADEY